MADGQALAFVPAPLPPELAWDLELVSWTAEAEGAIGQLRGVLSRELANPHLISGAFSRREAVLSSAIEGTQASLTDLFIYETAGEREESGDVREVANYVAALEYGQRRLTDMPLSLPLLRELHAELMAGVRGQHGAGEFRRIQNWIGAPGSRISEATYVPPPPGQMHVALEQLEQFLHAPTQVPLAVRLALVHYQFEAIHPFLDGNGRIGRLLISLMLSASGALGHPLLYISAFFERHRGEYYQLLQGVSQRSEWREFVLFFLRGVVSQGYDAVRRYNKLLELYAQYQDQLGGQRAAHMLGRLVGHLFHSPVLTLPKVVKMLAVSKSTAQGYIDKLLALGLVAETSGRQRYRIYVATEVLRVLEEEGLEFAP